MDNRTPEQKFEDYLEDEYQTAVKESDEYFEAQKRTAIFFGMEVQEVDKKHRYEHIQWLIDCAIAREDRDQVALDQLIGEGDKLEEEIKNEKRDAYDIGAIIVMSLVGIVTFFTLIVMAVR